MNQIRVFNSHLAIVFSLLIAFASTAQACEKSGFSMTRMELAEVQATLNDVGFDAGEPDGLCGPRTRTAIAQWQHSRGIAEDGMLDAESFGYFLAQMNNPMLDAPESRPDNTLKLWDMAHVNVPVCLGSSGAYGPEDHDEVLKGYKWPNPAGGGGEFIQHTAWHLNLASAGQANDRALADRFLSAAENNAMTVLDFEGPGGSSPAFMSTLLVKGTAHAVAYLKSKNALTQAEIERIEPWIAKSLVNALARNETHALDHIASIAVTKMMWAAANEDFALFTEGQAEFYSMLNLLGDNPYFHADLRHNNEIMHHMVHGGYILHLNGVKVFDLKIGKHTLHDAVAHHAGIVAQTGAKKVKTASDPVDPARSIFRSQGFGTHLAWIPVYLAANPEGMAANEVRALDDLLRQSDWKPYWGGQMAIHSGCMFGQTLLD